MDWFGDRKGGGTRACTQGGFRGLHCTPHDGIFIGPTLLIENEPLFAKLLGAGSDPVTVPYPPTWYIRVSPSLSRG